VAARIVGHFGHFKGAVQSVERPSDFRLRGRWNVFGALGRVPNMLLAGVSCAELVLDFNQDVSEPQNFC